jgi:hypothetical protein
MVGTASTTAEVLVEKKKKKVLSVEVPKPRFGTSTHAQTASYVTSLFFPSLLSASTGHFSFSRRFFPSLLSASTGHFSFSRRFSLRPVVT